MIDITGKDQSWWPDLTGQTVAILAGGPSLTQEQCDIVRARGWYAVAINESWLLAQWAPALFGCDWTWWRSRRPLKGDFKGLRIIGSLPLANKNRVHLPDDMRWQAELLHYIPVKAGYVRMVFAGRDIGAGQSSAFQASNWAVRCGAQRLVLLGVDCHSPNKHHHGHHTFAEANHQTDKLMETWIKAWEASKDELHKRGIEVINCSPGSALKTFKRMDVKNA